MVKASAAAAERLAAHGENFMTMFDDYNEHKASRANIHGDGNVKLRRKPTDADDGERALQEAGSLLPAAKRLKSVDPSSIFGDINALRKRKVAQQVDNASRQAADLQREAAARSEYKNFMSPKAASVHAKPASLPANKYGADEDGSDLDLDPEQFDKLQQEVERLGATALDKKQRKAHRARMLARIGAKAERGPRTPRSIGFGMARKKSDREARATEEAIESGMLKRKGLGNKKKAEKQRAMKGKPQDRGLQEAGPGFRGGVLRLNASKGGRRRKG